MRIKSLTQTLKIFFSNEPKIIPKPNPIEFNFKIPNNNEQAKLRNQSQKVNSEIKVVKIKRNIDINKILKKKKEGDQFKYKVQQAYQQQQQNKIEDNIKTSQYHQQQYSKGEYLLQNIPLNPYYTYKLADFQRKLELQKDNLKDLISDYKDYDAIAETKFKIAEQYHQKQQKYEIEEFLRYLDEYPGSPKGPKPEDDMEYYIEYAYKRIPEVLGVELAGKRKLKQDKEKMKSSNNMNDLEYLKLSGQAGYSSILSSVRTLQPGIEDQQQSMAATMQQSDFPMLKQTEQIPQVPEMEFHSYQQWMKDWTNWKDFKNYYVRKNGSDKVKQGFDYLCQVQKQNDPEPQNQYFTPKGNAPSLLRYYKTLPKEMQDNPALKDIYLGLEYCCPFIPYPEKQDALNLACTMILPLDKVSQRAMSDFVNDKKKYYLTPFIVDKIFSINPEFTWDIKEFFAQIKREQLKGQSMIKQNEGSFPEPPQVHLQWEQGAPSLPVDFYDNDDGFWDEIISQKLKRQDQAKPINKVRKHFYH